MRGVYIQTENGLQKVSGEDITAKKVTDALGYTPADIDEVNSHNLDEDIHVTPEEKSSWSNKSDSDHTHDFNELDNKPDIQNDENGEFVLADEQGNMIAKVDKDGIHTTDVETKDGKVSDHLKNEDIHITPEEREHWDTHTHDFNELDNKPDIQNSEEGEFVLVDPSGNIIFRVNYEGVHSTEMNLKGTKILETLLAHIGDVVKHITEEERTKWNTASDKVTDTMVSNSHAHNNKETLDKVSEDIINNSHAHENKEVLDSINQSKVDSWNNKSDSNHKHDFNELNNKPNISTDGEEKDFILADNNGNIIARIDANGFTTTKVTTNDLIVGGEDIKEKFNSLHKHSNKSILDKVTEDVVNNQHKHENKEALDNVTQDLLDDIHTHTNKSTLDKVTESMISKSHDHGNKQALDAIEGDTNGEFVLTDPQGNIIFRVDAQGVHSTEFNVNGNKLSELPDIINDTIKNNNYIRVDDEVTETVLVLGVHVNAGDVIKYSYYNDTNYTIKCRGDQTPGVISPTLDITLGKAAGGSSYRDVEGTITIESKYYTYAIPAGVKVYIESSAIVDIPNNLNDKITTVEDNLDTVSESVTILENNLGGLKFSVTADGILQVTY